MIIDRDGCPMPEGLVDLMVTAPVARHDLMGEAAYVAMAPRFDGAAFAAARELVAAGRDQPDGYTELVLHRWRSWAKAGATKAGMPNWAEA